MGIADYETEEIVEELKRREEISKITRPKPMKNQDLTDLIIRCEEYIDLTEINDPERFDYESIIHEEVIQAVYGDAGWNYIGHCEEINNKK